MESSNITQRIYLSLALVAVFVFIKALLGGYSVAIVSLFHEPLVCFDSGHLSSSVSINVSSTLVVLFALFGLPSLG